MTGANWTEFDIPADSGAVVPPDTVTVDRSTRPSIYFMVQFGSKVFKITNVSGSGFVKLGSLTGGVAALHNPIAISVR